MEEQSQDDQERTNELERLIQRFDDLLEEINIYKSQLQALNRTHTVRFGGFDTTIKSDFKFLCSLRDADDESASSNLQSLCSSNIPSYEATWDAAKRSYGLVAFKQKFLWKTPPSRRSRKNRTEPYSSRDHGVRVDIVTANGTEWIKVASINEKRLMHDIAKEGWAESDAESGDDEETRSDDDDDSDEGLSIPVLKLAKDLMRASKTNRVRYRDPVVRMILPRMVESSPLIKKVMDKIRATGCILELGAPPGTPDIDEALPALLTLNENYADLTSVLNMDTTVMLALVSDISHDMAEADALDHPQKREQARNERKDQLLPSVLYPATAGRQMVCTREAMSQMRQITEPIANTTEKKRADLLFTEDANLADEAKEDIRAQFAALSAHLLPPTFLLPILIVDKDEECEPTSGFSPPIARRVGPKFADHNASVFIYGWRTGRTTLTSNWTTVKHFEEAIERARLDPSVGVPSGAHVSGPAVWFIPLSRSLAGMDRGDKYYGQDRLELYKMQTASSRDGYKERRRRRAMEKNRDRRPDENEDEQSGAMFEKESEAQAHEDAGIGSRKT